MRILLTNDDGIQAVGFRSLHAALEGLGELVPIAPLTVQSATSHGITYHDPLFVEDVDVAGRFVGTAVDGRPADCVKLAITTLWEERFGKGERPDLTISGLNSGANIGINVLYSGTVAAAMESAFLGVPSIAVSLLIADKSATEWSRAAALARIFIDRILDLGLESHDVVNLNLPRTETPDLPVPDLRVVPMNTAPLAEHYEHRTSPAGQQYYWEAGTGLNFEHTAAGSDVEAIFEGAATVTPLSFDMTSTDRMDSMKKGLETTDASVS